MDDLVLSIASNQEQILEYEKIRDDSLYKAMGVIGFNKSSPGGIIVLGHLDGQIIGGIRLDIGRLGDGNLPLEKLDIGISTPLKILPGTTIGQYSGLGIKAEIKDKMRVAQELVSFSTKVGSSRGCKHLFAYASNIHTRLYKGMFRRLGYQYLVHGNVDLPKQEIFHKFKMLLSSATLTPSTKLALLPELSASASSVS